MRDYIIYHGSEKIVRQPVYGGGKISNDYGQGFYCTEDVDLANEWACGERRDGYCNRYQLDGSGLTELWLGDGNYHILNWLAILLENRTFRLNSGLRQEAKEYLLAEFLPNYKDYDVIRGWRADDSYFSFADLFLNNGLSLQDLEKAIRLGNLGEQVMIQSAKAFSQLHYVGYEPVASEEWYPKKSARDAKARSEFQKMKQNVSEGIFLVDILRGEWRNDDERLQRIILK